LAQLSVPEAEHLEKLELVWEGWHAEWDSEPASVWPQALGSAVPQPLVQVWDLVQLPVLEPLY
jgi:hypothetical protein